jgi:hypothetical protein
MTPVDWYFARGNKQMGPVSAVDLKRLAAAGELLPDDLVWREGLTEWTKARNVRGLFDEESKPAAAEEPPSKAVVALSQGPEPAAQAEELEPAPQSARPRAPARHPIDALLDWLRRAAGVRFIEATARASRTCGLYGLLAAMALIIAFAAIVILKTRTLGDLPSGVTLLLLLVVLQYVAGRFLDLLDRLNRASGGRLASAALPDAVALLSLMAGLATLLGPVSAAAQASMYPIVLGGIAGLLVHVYLACVALSPATIGVSIAPDETAAGEEAIGAMMFLLKALLRTVPVAFGVGVLWGTILMGYACCQALWGAEGPLAAPVTASLAGGVLIFSAVLPFAAYLLFLLCSLIVELCRALLGLPRRSDRPDEKEIV